VHSKELCLIVFRSIYINKQVCISFIVLFITIPLIFHIQYYIPFFRHPHFQTFHFFVNIKDGL